MPLILPIRPGDSETELKRVFQHIADKSVDGTQNHVVKRLTANISNSTELTDPTSLTAFNTTLSLRRGTVVYPGSSVSIYAAGSYRILTAATTLQINSNFDGTNNLCNYASLPSLAVTSGSDYRPWTLTIHCILRDSSTVSAHAVYTVYDEAGDSRSFTSMTQVVVSPGVLDTIKILAAFGGSNGHKIRLENLICEYTEVIKRI